MSIQQLFRGLVLTTLILWGSGCVSAPKPPNPQANWKTIPGQVRYADEKRSFVADVTIREGRSTREYSLEVNKAGAILLQLERAETQVWARGPLAHWPWNGLAEKAPAHLQIWLRETSAALENKPADKNSGILFRLQR